MKMKLINWNETGACASHTPQAVADPGFLQRLGGAPIPKLGLFCKFFAENCMKMKEFGPPVGGGGSMVPPLDPPMPSPPPPRSANA